MNPFDKLLSDECTVRIAPEGDADYFGTGFFVAPGQILTCAHVVDPKVTDSPVSTVDVWWNGQECKGKVPKEFFFPVSSGYDIALVQVPWTKHPCVLLNEDWERNDQLFGFGFSGQPPKGSNVKLEIEGWRNISADVSTDFLLKLRDGELQPGHSGVAIRNEKTGGICGIAQLTRGGDLGGYALPTSIILSKIPHLVELQRSAHRAKSQWLEIMKPAKLTYSNKCLSKDCYTSYLQRHWLAWEKRYPGLNHFDHPPINEPSPLAGLWSEFIVSPPWHKSVLGYLSELNDAIANAPKLSPILKKTTLLAIAPILKKTTLAIESEFTYHELNRSLGKVNIGPAIRYCKKRISDLNKILAKNQQDQQELNAEYMSERDSLRNIEDLLYKLGQQRDFPAYKKCFLILGSLGAGKTHFFIQQIEYPNSRLSNLLLLPLIWMCRDQSIESLVLKSINEASNMLWQDLRSFHDFLNENDLTVVIVLDDLQKWLQPEFLKKFIDFVKKMTFLERILWLVTLQNIDYYDVSSEQRFWSQYGFPGPKPPTGIRQAIDEPITNMGGWLLADQFNDQCLLGMNIFRRWVAEIQGGEPYKLAIDQLDPQDETHQELVRQIANPGLAWIALELINRIPPEAFINLRYVEFTDKFLEIRLEKINLAEEKIYQKDIEEVVELVAATMLQSGEVAPLKAEFTATLKELAARWNSQLADPQRLQRSLQVLQRMNLLLEIELEAPQESIFSKELRVELNFITFWHRYLAESLLRRAMAEGQKVRKALKIASEWLAKANSETLREGVWEFFLLLLDRKIEPIILKSGKTRLDKFTTRLWQAALQNPNWPAIAVWFAGPKASNEAHRFLLGELPKHSDGSFTKKHIFSVMYFIDQCDSRIGPKRLSVLRPFYIAIKNAFLTTYFLYIAKRILGQEYDDNLLVKEMLELNGCEQMGVADPLAQTAIASLARNAGEDSIQMLPSLYYFLEGCSTSKDSRNAQRERPDSWGTNTEATQNGESGDSWQRQLFREWVLRHFCFLLIEEEGAKAYWLLEEHGWYNSNQERIHHRIRHDMSREASFIFGWWFRKNHSDDKRKHQYLDLVRELWAKPEENIRKRAFYLILHTVPQKKRVKMKLDNIFLPVLRDMQKDTAIAIDFERNKNFVAFNLK